MIYTGGIVGTNGQEIRGRDSWHQRTGDTREGELAPTDRRYAGGIVGTNGQEIHGRDSWHQRTGDTREGELAPTDRRYVGGIVGTNGHTLLQIYSTNDCIWMSLSWIAGNNGLNQNDRENTTYGKIQHTSPPRMVSSVLENETKTDSQHVRKTQYDKQYSAEMRGDCAVRIFHHNI